MTTTSPETPDREQRLLVSELFGPTFQGEGPSVGQRAMFLRLSRCNLSCSWCDTPYTWDFVQYDVRTETETLAPGAVLGRLLRAPANLTVITGGEPLLQTRALLPVVTGLTAAGKRVEVETNGTVSPPRELVNHVARFNVSPKLHGAGLSRDTRIKPEALAQFAGSGKAIFKFVVSNPDELDEIAELDKDLHLGEIWVMPEGTDPEALLTQSRWLADAALDRGFHFTTRLHVLLWGDVRGR
jgi:7-carboxy-7-deazaguanine synthase